MINYSHCSKLSFISHSRFTHSVLSTLAIYFGFCCLLCLLPVSLTNMPISAIFTLWVSGIKSRRRFSLTAEQTEPFQSFAGLSTGKAEAVLTTALSISQCVGFLFKVAASGLAPLQGPSNLFLQRSGNVTQQTTKIIIIWGYLGIFFFLNA